MKPIEVPITDSGYPTPRDDLPSSSRSSSPSSPDHNQMTSTPVRTNRSRTMKDHFAQFHNNLSMIESTGSDSISPSNEASFVLEGVKSVLAVSKEIKKQHRENSALREENETLRYENESLREENLSYREESKRFEERGSSFQDGYSKQSTNVNIPKLQLHDDNTNAGVIPPEQLKSSEQIKQEILSFVKNDDDRNQLEEEMKNMLISSSKLPPKVFMTTANIQVDTETIDANVQTENDDAVSVINANLKLEVDQLSSQKELIEKKNTDLENRLFDYEQLKVKFEEDEQKLRSDLEKKLKISLEKVTRLEGRIEELQFRLNKKKKEFDEVISENQRLLEEKNTQDFELDELKVHGDQLENEKKEIEEKAKELENDIKKLQEALEEEKVAKQQLCQDIVRISKEHEDLVTELNKRAQEALSRESVALEQLRVVQAENDSYMKENKYLSESRQVLLDSENNLKNDVNVLTANLRQKDIQVLTTQEQVLEEKRHCEKLELQVAELLASNKKLNEEKYESDELLAELRKGKVEIDHLRQQLQIKSHESDEVSRLKEKVEQYSANEHRLKEKLEDAIKKDAESEVKLEEYIRAHASAATQLKTLTEENTEQKVTIDSMTHAGAHKDAEIAKLSQELEDLNAVFDEFKKDANLQYENDIFVRNQQIESLHDRLIQLETYPGQNISVSRKTAGVQTDEVSPAVDPILSVPIAEENVVSPEVSLVSEELVPSHVFRLEEKVKRIVAEMKQIVEQQHIESRAISLEDSPIYITAKIFEEMAHIFDSLSCDNMNDMEATGQEIEDLWSSLNGRIQRIVTIMDEKMEEVKKKSDEKYRSSGQKWESEMTKMQEKLNEMATLAEERLDRALQFKEHYEFEEKQKKEIELNFLKLQELRNEELDENEKLQRSLRERLELAEHTIQRNFRENMKRNEEYEGDLEHLTAKVLSLEEDNKREVKKHNEEVERLNAEIQQQLRKRNYDKKTMKSLIESCNIHKEKLDYLKDRNTKRQILLNHVNSVIIKMSGIEQSKSAVQIVELCNYVNKSGLLSRDDVEAAIANSEHRRPFGINNK